MNASIASLWNYPPIHPNTARRVRDLIRELRVNHLITEMDGAWLN